MTSNHDDHSLVGAYAMDALDGPDLEQFERHLARCQDCTEELRSFVETTARLAAATPADPPDALKASTLAAAARMRQLPPLPARDSRLDRRRRRLTAARPIMGVAALVIVLLAATAGMFADGQRVAEHRLQSDQRNDALVQTVLSAPDATLLSEPMASGGTAHVVIAASKHALVFSVSDLHPPGPLHCYELWLIRGGRDEPGGTLPAASKGMVGPIPIRGIKSGDALGLSVEPEHGSPRPTAHMIAQFARL